MRSLAADRRLARGSSRAGYESAWRTHHTMEEMANDYRRIIRAAASPRPVPAPPPDLPAHFTGWLPEPARAIARQFGLSLDVLNAVL